MKLTSFLLLLTTLSFQLEASLRSELELMMKDTQVSVELPKNMSSSEWLIAPVAPRKVESEFIEDEISLSQSAFQRQAQSADELLEQLEQSENRGRLNIWNSTTTNERNFRSRSR